MSRVVLKPLLTPHLIKGLNFTLDAMHTQRALRAQIHRFGGDYLLIAKDNQTTLQVDSADLFEDRTPNRRDAYCLRCGLSTRSLTLVPPATV